jgi:hypothetical protein
MAGEWVQVPDQEVERLAKEHGPESMAAKMLADLHSQRAKDRQVFAFRFGNFWITGPEPDAKTEAELVDLALGEKRNRRLTADARVLGFVVTWQNSPHHPPIEIGHEVRRFAVALDSTKLAFGLSSLQCAC